MYYVGSIDDAGRFVAATPRQAVDNAYGAAFYDAQWVLVLVVGPCGERLVVGNQSWGWLAILAACCENTLLVNIHVISLHT